MIKEYFFCKKYDEQIESKAKKIYEKQIETGIVAQYHCNFKLLESVADTYCKSIEICTSSVSHLASGLHAQKKAISVNSGNNTNRLFILLHLLFFLL